MEHWYTRDAKPCYTQKTKKGAQQPERPTNLKDAKKLKLLPSCTNILRTINMPWLERWKYQKIVEACFKRPPIADESQSEYESYILKVAFDEVDKAANLGTRIHANIEALVKKEPMPNENEADYARLAIHKIEELGLTIQESEITVANEKHGYGGTTDLAVAKGKCCGIVDFKSTKTKEGEPILPKLGHAAQIAAYHVAYWTRGEPILDNTIGYNVYISTTEPGRIDVMSYDADELRREWEFFLNACAIWRHKNEYDPRSSG